jgi:hypothetical protein
MTSGVSQQNPVQHDLGSVVDAGTIAASADRPLPAVGIAPWHAWLVRIVLARTLALPGGKPIAEPIVGWPHAPEFVQRKAVKVLLKDFFA